MFERPSIITKEGIKVEVGQVWRDLDKRVRRTVTVERVDDYNGKAIVRATNHEGVVSKQTSTVSINRMHRHGQGFALVSQPTQDPQP